jgi:GH24 family phage-related lysozyme (muramidase)
MQSDLERDLIRDEGYRYDAYPDSEGNWTIGVGHLIGGGSPPRIRSLTDDEIVAFMKYDIFLAEQRCRKYFPVWTLMGSVRQDALINMSFNLGGRFGAFTKMIAAVNAAMNTLANDEYWQAAGREMMDSVWAKQVGQRAVRLRHMIEVGERMV